MNLRACLDQCSLGLLRQIAERHNVPIPEPPARAEVIRVLLERLLAPGYLKRFTFGLAEHERRALEIVAADGGQLRGFVLDRRLRRGTETNGAAAAASVAPVTLIQSGLLFRAFQAVGPDRGEVYLLPDELRQLLPARRDDTGLTAPPADQPIETMSCASVFSLFSMASFVRRWRQREARQPRSEGQLSGLSQETAELAIELAGRSPRERWTLLAHLGIRLGLFAREQGSLQPTEGFEEWLGLGDAAERQLWDDYVSAEHWNDLERAGSGASRFAGRTAEPHQARAQLLDVVGSLADRQWVLVTAVERLVRERAPDFLREGFEVATSRLVDLESGEVLGGPDSWERVEAPLVRYLLAGPLYWLGVLEWGKGPEDWDRIRLTEAGLLWLAGADSVLRRAPAPFDLTEERRLVASDRCDLGLLWQLEPYLELERRGPPSRYLLSRASFARGLESGGSVVELRRLLDRASAGSPPLTFSLALERWGARAGRFRLRPMVVLTVEDGEELSGLLERPEVREIIRERLGPTAAAVRPTRAQDLGDLLERLGQLPELDPALRLGAGRRAHSALVDQHTLEALLFCIRLVKWIKPELTSDIPDADRLVNRLEQALGPITAPRISRRARRTARRLRDELRSGASRDGDGVARPSNRVL